VPLLEIQNLVKVFSRDIRAVDDVSLDIQAGETLGLVGESGSGKSTLGRLILRLIEPTSGSVHFEGRDLLAASSREMRRLRRDMQIIFQDPFASLDPRYRVEDIIAEPLLVHGWSNASGEKDLCGDSRPRLSGRAKLDLRCDEPVSALDVSVGAQIINLLAQLQRDFGLTYLFISHSMPVVRYLATRIAVMYKGKVVEVGDTDLITGNPVHPYTRNLLEATPELQA
jgi:ABC-type oligopeptide transport system ATPase subunit